MEDSHWCPYFSGIPSKRASMSHAMLNVHLPFDFHALHAFHVISYSVGVLIAGELLPPWSLVWRGVLANKNGTDI